MRSVIERRFFDSGVSPCSSACTVAATAPHRVWPITTTSGVPKRDTANSTEPIPEGATTLPATRMTKRSPSPWSNTSSAGARESEQPRTTANGR